MHARQIAALWSVVLFSATLLQAGDLDIRFNEVLYHPPGDLEDAEFVELVNIGAEGVDLGNWNLAGGVEFTFATGTVVPPGGFLLVVKDRVLAAGLYPGVSLAGNYAGRLSNGSDRLRLENADGILVDEFEYSDGDGWPEAADGRGASLEKIDPERDPWFADSWGPSLTLLGSPGMTNTQLRKVVPLDWIVAGEDWRYLKGTAEPDADWAAAGYDATSWLQGPTGIGYGDDDDATILDDMMDGYTTVYLRQSFDVSDPDKVLSFLLSVDYDDGIVVYLNGTEVARRNAGGVSGEPLPFDALAAGNHEAGVPEQIDLTPDASLLVAGTNVLAIQVLNQALTSSDLSIIPALSGDVEVVGSEVSLSRLAPVSAVARSSSWKYFKGVDEPSAAGEWISPSFDDGSWLMGTAGFGYGDGDDATVLDDMRGAYSTVYIRKSFSVSGTDEISGMVLGVDYDDGFIAYLNGVEVARTNAPGAEGELQPYTALANSSHEAGTELVIDLAARTDLLAEGDNVLAIQGLNATLSSSDFSLHPRLTLFRAVSGDPAALGLGISINELYLPDASSGWVEIANSGPEDVSLSGYGLSDDLLDPLKYTFPPTATVPAGGFLVINELALGFNLALEGTLLLTDPEGVILVDGKRYAVTDATLSAGAYPDGDDEFSVLEAPTEGAPNTPPPDRGVVINEIMYHPLGDPTLEELEWIELANRTGFDVDLTGWRFTRGISYDLPDGTILAAGGHLVIARDPAGVEAHYGISGVLGGYSSGLQNDDEIILLRDDLGNTADRVHYADDGRWPEEADGAGPSVELVHPDLDNHTGQAWRASTGEGTPGAANSMFSLTPPPLVLRLQHSPTVPRDGEPVLVTAEITALDGVADARLFYRAAGSPSFEQAALLDDGLSGDGGAGDGVYGATIPGQALGTVVEFFVEGEATSGEVQLVPPSAPASCNLYAVDAPASGLGTPTYRVVMTPADRQELESRDVWSNVLLNATFIAGDEAYYGVGVRYRGKSSRLKTPKSYRVEFTDDEEFEGIKHLNLNAYLPHHQHMGMHLFRGADVPASLTRVVRYIFCTEPERTYVRMEEVGEDFLSRYYSSPGGEDDGNLYRGNENGNLDYRGADKEDYRPSYKKETNEEEDDWSGLIHLCDVLTNTSDADLPSVLPTIIDVDEWIRFFAAHTLISTQEGGIYRDKGDDYYVYRRPSDGLWVLIPWDLDDSFRQPTERLFRPTLPSIRRVLQHPDFSPSYYTHLVQLSGTHFSEERILQEQALLADIIPQSSLDTDLAFVESRLDFVDSETNQEFTVELRSEALVAEGDTWKFFRGTQEPSGGTLQWTEPSFDDGVWESGPSGIGYGDGDDSTVLDDMMGAYTTVYARHAFTVDDPARFSSLELSIDYDDGFVAFLNGVEIARANAGASGTYPTFDALATAQREAGAKQVFTIPSTGTLLVAGTNVLAIVALNATIDSSDLSLIPEIRTGGVVGEGCPGELYLTGHDLLFAGLAPVTQTRYVRVDGVDATYDSFSGVWSFQTPLDTATRTVTVEALAPDLTVVATDVLDITRVHTLGGVVSEDTAWSAADSPYLVTGSVTVPAGAHLVIEPGCDFLLDEGVDFLIEGEIQALGTVQEPITFTRIPCHANWGFFTFRSREANRLQYCEFSRGTASPGCLTVRSSNLDLESCHIHHITGEGVSASSSTINIYNTTVERTHEALSLDGCRTIVEFNTLRNLIGKSDLCDANGSNNPPARIAFNTMYGTPDDGIDADRGSVYAEGNLIHNCNDQGISLVGSGSSTVYRNIVYNNNYGMAVKNSQRAVADFNTFVFNRTAGVRAYEKSSGQGGGIITLKNSVVWGNPTSLYADALSEITTTYSDVQGDPLTPGEGNINVDPQFVDPGANDFRLQSTSPCIGTAEGGDDMGALPYEVIPRPPSDLAVTGTTANSVALAWKDNSAAEDAYELERRISVGFTPQYIVREGDAWKFFRGRSEPSGGTLDWTDAAFDDASWEEGPTGIGYGDGDDATVLSDMRNQYSTVYLRHAFEVADVAGITGLELVIDYDDAFIAFLNGVEIARRGAGVAGTYPPFDGLAAEEHEAGAVLTIEFPVSGVLVAGTNVLAIQGLNVNLSSSDLTLIPELRTIDEAPFELAATLPPNTHSHVDEGLSEFATYSYRVRATNAMGESAYSNVVTVETGTVPAAPSDLAVLGFDPASITLGWTDNSADEDSFELERSVAGGEFELLVSLPSDTSSYVDTAVVAGESYSYRVRAINVLGASGYSNVVTQVPGTKPLAPTDLAVGEVTLDSIALSWVDNSDDETNFEVEVSLGGGDFQSRALLAAGTTAYTDEALQPGETYSYRVRAINPVGPSEYSNVVSATTQHLPAVPQDVSVTDVGLDTITLTWIDAADNETGFELERRGPGESGFSIHAELPAETTSYTDTGLEPGAVYTYRLRAVNEFGSSDPSGEATAATGRLPAAPANLHATSVDLESVGLAWLDSADNETGLELERSEQGGAFVKIADLPADTASYLDTGLLEGTEYTYRIRAVNEFGASDYSPPVAITTGSLPEAPSGLTLTFRGHDTVSFSWVDNSDNETGFAIERSDERGPFHPAGDISENGTAFTDTDLLPGTEYGYRVIARGEFGSSPPSEILTVTTGSFPDAPTGLTATATWIDTIKLAWVDASDNESGFELERRLTGGGAFLKIADVPADTQAFTDSGVEPGRGYTYRIRSVNEFGVSDYSAEASATTPEIPAAPSGLTVISVGLDSLELAWGDNSDNEDSFELQRKGPGDADFVTLATLAQDTTRHTNTGLESGETYAYRVRAVNLYGASPYSAVLTITTARLPDAPSGLAIVGVGLDSIELAWSDNADNETGYEIERMGPGDADFEPLIALLKDSTGYLDEALQNGAAYTYRVRAINLFGPSPFAGPLEGQTLQPVPEIDSIAPPETPSSGGAAIVIQGLHFLEGSTVQIGGTPATDIEIVSPTEIHAVAPPGERGAADVTVTAAAGSATLEGGFTYFDAYARGNANGDATLDISDAVHLLNYLFLGGAPPPCDDVANSNSDGTVDLSDAIFLLDNLFLGGSPIEPPEAKCY